MSVPSKLAQQDDADGDKERGEPAAAVDVLMQEEFGRDGIADIGEGADGRASERELGDRERKEHGEEVERHAERAEHEGDVGENGANSAGKAAALTNEVEISELLHAAGDEDLSGDCECGDERNG